MSKSRRKLSILTILIIIIVISVLGGLAYGIYRMKISHNAAPININESGELDLKPVIYLYPTKTQEVRVRIDYNGEFVTTYPDYDAIDGWTVIANPDGTLINKTDNKQYSYLFWEGERNTNNYNLSTGFIVSGEETKVFLQNTLDGLGLLPKEYNEMIVYWLPKMERNRYNLIHFAQQEYTNNAKLLINPRPESILRVFMVYKPLNEYRVIKPQALDKFYRKGFTVVEWGGAEVK